MILCRFGEVSIPTKCSAESFDFGTVEGRCVEAAFDAWLVTSDAAALLLGATNRAIRLMDRFASCFHDEQHPQLIEHEVATLVGQWFLGSRLATSVSTTTTSCGTIR
jgi:hypothetical protein